MRNSYLKIMIFLLLAGFCSTIIGCGETFSGVGKDVRRMGKGVKTIFVRDGAEQ